MPEKNLKPPRSEEGSLRGNPPQAGFGAAAPSFPPYPQIAKRFIKKQESGSEANPDSAKASNDKREAEKGTGGTSGTLSQTQSGT